MPITLGIDTTGPACSLALLRDEVQLGAVVDPAVGSAENLLPQLLSLLASCSLELGSIDRIAVCNGPGSFTGIRTGIASAQGIAFGRGLPVLGVSSLLCRLAPLFLAIQPETIGEFVPMITAREEEYYSAAVAVRRQGNGDFELVSVADVEVVASGEASEKSVILDDPSECGGLLAARSFVLCEGWLRRGYALKDLGQIAAGGVGLEPLYVKPVNAKTIEERFGGTRNSVD